MARGSAGECAACLDVLLVRKLASEEQVLLENDLLVSILQMLLGYFANSLSGPVFCAKKNRHILQITITITSGSTSRNDKAFCP